MEINIVRIINPKLEELIEAPALRKLRSKYGVAFEKLVNIPCFCHSFGDKVQFYEFELLVGLSLSVTPDGVIDVTMSNGFNVPSIHGFLKHID